MRLRQLVKRIGKSTAARRAIAWIAASYIRLVYYTSRWDVEGLEQIQPLHAAKRSYVGAYWHGRMMLMPHFWLRRAPERGLPMRVLISGHRDGMLISRAITYFGFETITGSKTRGGHGALRGLMRSLDEGIHVSVTPDGPRGPRMRLQPGVITLAVLSGAPLLPITFSAARCRVLGTWDRFLVALPFNRGIILIGEPFTVPKDADEFAREAARLEFERRMNALVFEADRRMGRTPVEPAPAAALARAER